MMKLLQRFDDKIVNWEPYWSAPIRVSAKDSRLRFCRLIVHDFLFAVYGKAIGMIPMIFAYRTNAVVAKKFLGIEHTPK